MMRLSPRRIAIVGCTLLGGLGAGGKAIGQAAWSEGFEGPQPTWRDAGGDARYRIEQHQRRQDEAHGGDGCEWLAVRGDHGTYVHVAHDVGRPRVIDELRPSVWIKSDRPGLQIAARVVLPRTADPRSGRPVATLVQGASYTDVGRWQQLRIDDVPRLLARQVRVLRTQLGPHVDSHEAYLDSVVLNVYGGPGVTNVWIDDLEVAGHVAVEPTVGGGADTVAHAAAGDAAGHTAPAASEDSAGRLVGSVLTAQGRPVFPRIVQHQGEPLPFLRQLGFNAVWLARTATAEQLQEAGRLGLWLICPPPRPTGPALAGDAPAALSPIGPEYNPVLAWDLGRGLSTAQLDASRRWAQQVRAADRRRNRPLVCLPESGLRDYSRLADVLLIDRRPLGTALELSDWGTWIRHQPRLARPGTPIWTTIQTQPSPVLGRQLAALDPAADAPRAVPSEQIRLLAYTAIGSGSRGLLFVSQSPLDATDPANRQRAMTLELLNLEMHLLDPWAAAGTFQATAEATTREVRSAVLRSDRARLLLPVWLGPGAQHVPGQSAANSLSLVVPGVPESCNPYHLVPGGLLPLRHERVTGGMRVTFEEFGLTAAVLWAQDPLLVSNLTRRLTAIGARAARLQRDLAARKLHVVQQVVEQLPGGAVAGARPRHLAEARKQLQWADGYLASHEYPKAYLHAHRAMRPLRLLGRAEWEAAVAGLDSPMSVPPATSLETLPWYVRWVERIRASRLGANRLAAGDFERLDAMLAAGWQHRRYDTPGVQSAAELVADAAHSGFSGLRLSARADDPENPPGAVETPPVWITSPAVAVEAGRLFCISGWVHVGEPIAGSVDRLVIVDSLAGDALALRLGQTEGWRQFVLYRAAPNSGWMNVSFVLAGLGEVRLDDVSIQALVPAALTRRPR